MIVPCPACQTRFNVNINALSDAGRKVRCTKCGETWYQMPANEVNSPFIQAGANKNSPPADGQFQKEKVDGHADMRSIENLQSSKIDKSSPAILESTEELELNDKAKNENTIEGAAGGSVRWLFLIVLLCCLCGGGYFYRLKIVEFWPTAGPLFETIGLSPKNASLAVQNVTWAFKKEDGKLVLVVTGEVTNNSRKSQFVPHLSVEILDDRNRHLFGWTTSAIKNHLGSGQITKFFARLADPPNGAKSVTVKLQEKNDR